MAESLQIERFTLGMWQTNCYLLHGDDAETCAVIDVGFEPTAMIEAIRERNLRPERVVLTHAHVDHVGGLAAFLEQFPGTPVGIHPAEWAFPGDPQLNLSGPFGMPIAAPPPTETIEAGRPLTLLGRDFEVRHTPGHSPGGITLVDADAGLALVGDTLFAGSIGRFDFPTSDGEQLLRSIREQLLSLDDDVVVHPGHGPSTTIGEERWSNPFLR